LLRPPARILWKGAVELSTPEREMMLKRNNLNRILFPAGIVLLLLGFLGIAGCNFGIPDYTLYVTLDQGVVGNPGDGEHVYEDLSSVSYSYETIPDGGTVEVYLNETRLSGMGTFTMYNTASLRASIMDIRGTWNIKMTWLASSEVNFEFNITFNGPDNLGGTFTDSRGFHGTWTGLNNALYMFYTDWNDFALSGTVFDMSGSFSGEENIGTFEMERVD
jgi:hypothetical protein